MKQRIAEIDYLLDTGKVWEMESVSNTLLSVRSAKILATCDDRLQKVLVEAAMTMDFSVLDGKRSVTKQRAVRDAGFSKTLDSKHVYPLDKPSLAVDIAPYPIRWPKKPRGIKKFLWWLVRRYTKQAARFYFLMGYIKCISEYQEVELRFGLDWDGDMDFEDQTFDDLGHIELKETDV